MSSLISLSSSLTANDEDMVNCDQAKEVGEKIQKSLDGVAVTSAKMKKSDHVKTLQSLKTGIKVDKNNIHIEPPVLYLCVVLRLLNDSPKNWCHTSYMHFLPYQNYFLKMI